MLTLRWRIGVATTLGLLPIGMIVSPLLAQEKEHDQKTVERVRVKAETGDADSEFWLGVYYDAGSSGLQQDSVEAIKWYRKSAEQNYRLAESSLGLCYLTGRGVAKDEVEAVKWFRKAA